MRGQPLDVNLAESDYLRFPTGCLRFIPGLGDVITSGVRRGISWWWCAEMDRDGYALIDARTVLLHPRLENRPTFWIRRTATHESGHILTGSESEERAESYRVWHPSTEPELPVIHHTPELMDTDTLLELVWERFGMDWPEVEGRADDDGISSRALCLLLLDSDSPVWDEWMQAA